MAISPRGAASRVAGPALASARRPAAAVRKDFGLSPTMRVELALGSAGEASSPRVARS